MDGKKGLVLGGGGSRGSYEVGVCMALKELGYTFDIVTGVSIGALIGAMVVQDEVDLMVPWISNMKQSTLSDNLFMYPNQYNTKSFLKRDFNSFLEQFMKDGPDISRLQKDYLRLFDFEKFKSSPIDFACLSYNLNQNKLVAFEKAEMSEKDYVAKLFSSTAYFPAYQLIKVGDDYYADGGYEQTLPVEQCVKMGANSLIVVDLAEPQEQVDKICTSHVRIRPLRKLHSVLDFEAKDLVPEMRAGYFETLKYLDKAPGYLYTFFEEDWKIIQRVEKLSMAMLVREGQIGMLTQFNDAMRMVYSYFLHDQPLPLENKYSSQYIVGRLLEVLGILCDIPMERQYHFKDFIRLILAHFSHFYEDPNKIPYPKQYDAMEMKGVQDYVVFFHEALVYFHGNLPEGFDQMKKSFAPCYYVAQAWRVMENAQIFLQL
ncbi:hypothetical protein C815_01152 [Firmicutes bacterium M10-2]|nr:hypothetical protein C815_01152 [Firmicutes bacterium M10-2]